MGLGQGRALGEEIRAAVEQAGLPTHRSRWPSLLPLVSGPLRGRGAGRELFRHFAHQAERLEGLAQGAAVPLDSLLELQLRMRSPARAAPVFESSGEVPSAPALARGADAGGGFVVRESRPVVGFRSLEVTLPWLVVAVAGVNEVGLAVLASWPRSDDESGSGTGDGSGDRSGAAISRRAERHEQDRRQGHREGDAPAILLVQDCLARFQDLAGALDWCRKRPVEGELVLRFADASGASAQVVVTGKLRRIEKVALEPGPDGPRLMGALVHPLRTSGAVRVRLEPKTRRLRLDDALDHADRGGIDIVLPHHAGSESDTE
jgi:hypothetical protein